MSLGAKGFHYTIGAKGTRTTVGLPGSGLFWTHHRSYASRPRSSSDNRAKQVTDANTSGEEDAFTATDQNYTIFESAPIEHLVANSTGEIAEKLSTARRIWYYTKMILIILGILLGSGIATQLEKATGSLSHPVVVLAMAILCGIILVILLIIRRRLTTTLDYDLSDVEMREFSKLHDVFNKLARSERFWRIPIQQSHGDWKRNAGATSAVDRKQFALSVGNPPLIKSDELFLCLPLGNKSLYFCPDSILITAADSVASLWYDDLQIDYGITRFVEDERVPSDARVVGHSWRYVNRNGMPDRRFGNNRQLPICLYAVIDLSSSSGLNERILCSQLDASKEFVDCLSGMGRNTSSISSVAQAPVDSRKPNAQQGEQDEDLPTAFAQESQKAQDLALRHEKHWEILLVEELLKSKLSGLEKECDQFETTLLSIPKRNFDDPTFTSWLGAEMNELSLVTARIKKCMTEDLPASIGKAGVSGDAVKILRTVDALFNDCRSFLDFELNLCAADVPSRLNVFKTAFRGITRTAVGVIEDFTDQWSRNVENVLKGSDKFDINVTFAIPQVQKALAEIDKISNPPKPAEIAKISTPRKHRRKSTKLATPRNQDQR